MSSHSWVLFFLLSFSAGQSLAQLPSYPGPAGKDRQDSIAWLSKEYGNRKKLPLGFEIQALEALSHFPELKQVPVKFKVRPSRMTAKTRPGLLSSFLPKGSRTYIIVLSNKTIDILSPILIRALPYEAQVGLLGHELSHVSDFSQKTFLQSVGDLFRHFSPKYLDKLEYHTDLIAIHHGLGKNLKAWSAFIRNHYHRTYWRGSGYINEAEKPIERYMNPDTIERQMAAMQIGSP